MRAFPHSEPTQEAAIISLLVQPAVHSVQGCVCGGRVVIMALPLLQCAVELNTFFILGVLKVS